MVPEVPSMFQSLTRSDLKRALDAVGALAACPAGDAAFGRQGVASLGGLVASDLTTLSICNLATGQRRVVSDVADAIAPREIAAFDRHFHGHPLVRAHGRNAAAVTRRVSDLVPYGQFRRSALFDEYYRPIGI